MEIKKIYFYSIHNSLQYISKSNNFHHNKGHMNSEKNLCHAFNQWGSHFFTDGSRLLVVEFEDRFNDWKFRWSCILTSKCTPVIHHHTSPNDICSSVNSSSHQRNLKKRGEFLLVSDWGLWRYKATIITEGTVASNLCVKWMNYSTTNTIKKK